MALDNRTLRGWYGYHPAVSRRFLLARHRGRWRIAGTRQLVPAQAVTCHLNALKLSDSRRELRPQSLVIPLESSDTPILIAASDLETPLQVLDVRALPLPKGLLG